jgi:hypothetical protein
MQTKHSPKRSSLTAAARRTCLGFVAMAIVAATTCCCAPDLAAQQNTNRAGNSTAGFSFLPPAGWTVSTEYPDPRVRLLYLGPNNRGFRANVNMIVETDSGESFDDIATQSKKELTTLLSAKIAEEGRITIDGKEALYMSSAYRMGPLSLKNAQFFVRGGNGKFYVVSFTAAADAFDGLGPAIAQSARSIKIEKNKAPSLPKAPRAARGGKGGAGR